MITWADWLPHPDDKVLSRSDPSQQLQLWHSFQPAPPGIESCKAKYIEQLWLFIGLAHTKVGPELGWASTGRGVEFEVLSLSEQGKSKSVRCHKNEKKTLQTWPEARLNRTVAIASFWKRKKIGKQFWLVAFRAQWQLLHPCEQQLQDGGTVEGESCCGPRSLHPRLIQSGNCVQSFHIYLSNQKKVTGSTGQACPDWGGEGDMAACRQNQICHW